MSLPEVSAEGGQAVALDPLRRRSPGLPGPPGNTEERLSPRRRTLATVRVLAGAGTGEVLATDLSADGAFLRCPAGPGRAGEGGRLRLRLEIPTDPRPLEVAARVVRATPSGLGVRFEEVSARDRSRLRSHAGFYEMDEAIVRVQRALGDLIPGNLLPLGDGAAIAAILGGAVERDLPLTAILPGRGFRPLACRAVALAPAAGAEDLGPALHLEGLAVPPGVRALHLAFADPPLHYACEALVVAAGARPAVLAPERIYLTERRSDRRAGARDAWCELAAPWAPEGRLRLPVLDIGDGGAAVSVPAAAALVPGTHLPAFTLVAAGERRAVGGATVRYTARRGDRDGTLRVGLRFDDGDLDRDSFQELRRHDLRGSVSTRLARGLSLGLSRGTSWLGGRMAAFVRRREGGVRRGDVEVVRYRNRLGSTVAALVDANFDTADPALRPDAAVLIAPAILKRKEVFGLLARTVLDDLGRDGRRVVTLRFDASHIVGESSMDPRRVAEGRPYYDWTFDHLAADMEASLRYLERRFRPAKRALVSVSLSAIPARQVLRDARLAVDLWVAPYGCPDAQDVLRNYLAGLDLFPAYRAGGGPETILIHGRPIRGSSLYGQAMADGLAFLEDARRDLAKLRAPVVWIVGTYDGWVGRSRVRALLDAPGDGVREVFECATGHALRGAEAIEVFKLVSESIAKHLFGTDRPAREPDLGRFARQSEAEWARVKRLELADAAGFWKDHLLGAPGDGVGYDVLLDHPEYPRFLARQAELLDPRPGEDLADFGCGTGNLLLALLDALPAGAAPGSLTFLDLVPEGVAATAEKARAWFAARGQAPPPLAGVVADLEISRFAAVADFLAGGLHGVEGLVDRVEGLSGATARKLAARYGKELHAILRGAPATAERLRALCPDLEPAEAETALEVGRAARFLRGRLSAEDVRPGGDPAAARTAGDLRFRHLRFGAATARCALDLPAASFDRLGASLVLPYLYDPLAALREMHRLLRPGGVLVVSSIRPGFDPSKLYAEGVELLTARAAAGDSEAARHLAALRYFANTLSRLIELEEDGRFRFFDGAALCSLASEAGFVRAHAFRAFGSPPVAVVVRAEKPRFV